MPISTRIAAPHDIPAASEIRKLTLSPAHKHQYERNVGHPSAFNAVAVKDGIVAGFVSALIGPARPVPSGPSTGIDLWEFLRPYVAFLGVHPDHQRQGIGPALLGWVCDAIFRECRFEEIYLECTDQRRALYERAGFELMPSTEVEAKFHQRPAALVMRKIAKR
jgi:ribosomal protein S18 acetylase RimI-like enzyme